MSEASVLVDCLLRRQNADGGWSYNGLSSWAEPTSLALLALQSANATNSNYVRGCQWLAKRQRSDGGWAPNDVVRTSVAVTSLASLALSTHLGTEPYNRAVRWMLAQAIPDLPWTQRAAYVFENMPAREATRGGSPWFPGTSAWISPTVTATLALAESRRHINIPAAATQVDRGRMYLLSRQCNDGGWNHGGTGFRSAKAISYPEMTGMALLALDGAASAQIETGLRLAANMWRTPDSAEAQSWLRLALTKHRQPISPETACLPCRNTRDLCLCLLAATASSASNKMQTPTAA